MLLAALLAGAAFAAPVTDEVDRYNPVPPTTLTLTYKEMRVTQGGQRVRVTIPKTPGTNALGDRFTYRWNTEVYGPKRCQPGPLPDLTNVTAGTVIDAPLPRPPKSWCRGPYAVELEAVITLNCAVEPPFGCGEGEPLTQTVARAPFEVGPYRKTICHMHGQVERCWLAATRRDPASWLVGAFLDDLLGPDGATSDADPYFERAFRKHPLMNEHWEIDDNEFFGWPSTRKEAIKMAKLVDSVLRSGPYHGKTWPGREKR